jgi:hypothetical protein
MAFEVGATPKTTAELQKVLEDFGVDVEARIDQEHDGYGHHAHITAESLSASDTGAQVAGGRVSVYTGLHFLSGPWLFGLTDSDPGAAVIRPPTLTADQNDWQPSGIEDCLVVELESTADRTITGIYAERPLRRRFLKLVNRGNFTIRLKSASGSSQSHHQLYFGGPDYLLKTGTVVDLYYDIGSAGWRGPAGGGVKSIQTSAINWDGTGTGSQNFTLSVTLEDYTRAYVARFENITANNPLPTTHLPTLTSNTNIRVEGPTGSNISFRYTILEY